MKLQNTSEMPETETLPPAVASILEEKKPRHLKPDEFPDHHQYYWTYQYCLTKFYLSPLLESWGFVFTGKKILDVGCGNGGIACALIDQGARCVGIDITDLKKPNIGKRPFKFIQGDINEISTLAKLDTKFDLILLRDVIEHIESKEQFMRNLLSVLASNGKIFLSFPPYYSPFGGHTQILKTGLLKIPYIHCLPGPVFQYLVHVLEPSSSFRNEVLKLKKIRTTIGEMEKLFKKLQLKILQRKFYFLRPTFHIRYGVKPLVAFWGCLPLIREFTITAAFYYLEK